VHGQFIGESRGKKMAITNPILARRRQPVAGSSPRSPRRPGRVKCFCGERRLQRVSVIGVPDGLSDGKGVVATFFLIRYQTVIASRREISFARQFSRVSLTNRIEINFSPQVFGISLFINSVQQNCRDMLAKCSDPKSKQASGADLKYAICRGELYFATEKATSFWKRGSFRSGSNIGSNRSNAGVSGGFAASGAS
jgi:hypothetical protein